MSGCGIVPNVVLAMSVLLNATQNILAAGLAVEPLWGGCHTGREYISTGNCFEAQTQLAMIANLRPFYGGEELCLDNSLDNNTFATIANA